MMTLNYFSHENYTVVQPEDNFLLKNFAVVLEKVSDDLYEVTFWNLVIGEGRTIRSHFDYDTAMKIANTLHDALEYAD